MANEPRSPILIVSTRWQTRALLAAQIGEMSEGDVISAPDVDQALKLIKLAGVDPVALVVDTGRALSPEDVERLVEAQRGVPLVLVVSRLRRERFQGLRARSAATLVRPVSIGRVARTVVQVLGEPAG
ncbi:MAG: hypothetical protein R6X31_15025 [Anaerolineae bacterium]